MSAIATETAAASARDLATLDLEAEILRLKSERNAVLLAHYYQESEIQDLADHVGDSLALALAARDVRADAIVFAGVHFMAETAKILNPAKRVVVPDLKAGCSLSEGCPPDLFRRFVEKHRDHVVVTYVNSSAAVKAMSDFICTSRNAEAIVRAIPPEKPIIFAPDRNLGMHVMKVTGRPMLLWQGTCIVHETFSEREIVRLKAENPGALLLAHPECEPHVLRHADHVASTAGLLAHVKKAPPSVQTFIIATEPGIIHQMKKACPEKTFIPAPNQQGCACNQCPHMRLNTLEKLYLCLRDLRPEITLAPDLIARARRPIDRMLEAVPAG